MKFLILIAVLVLLPCQLPAEPAVPKYPVVTEGRKVSFEELQKSDFGKTVSVYLLPGRPKGFNITGILPAGALTQDKEKKIYIWTGELYSLQKDGIRLRWYYEAEKTSSSEYGAVKEDIDYILIRD